MASARDDGSNPARENMKELRRFQELYVGRFDTKEAVAIMERFNYDAVAAVDFVMTATNAEVMQLVKDEQASLDLAKKFENLRLPGSLLNDARLGRIKSTLRQFACEPCDHTWWRETPERKQVSKCYRCLVRYDPVPREEEWGWAEFKCPECEKNFSGHCAMTNTSPCKTCNIQVKPYCIKPPQYRRGRRSNNTHRCDAEDCGECAEQLQARTAAATRGGQTGARRGGRNMASRTRSGEASAAGGDLRNTDRGDAEDYDRSPGASADAAREGPPPPSRPAPCVYPSNRRRKVIYPSRPHDSTGSTVDTFMTQADFDGGSVASFRMAPIREK